jgi:3D (Asp-Asp-Asp) domain-containing protein
LNKKVVLVIALVALTLIVFLIKENQTLKINFNNQQNETNSRLQKIEDENKDLLKKNEDLTQEKEKIENEKQDILNSVNEKLLAMRLDSQIGNSKPSRSGIAPQFSLVSRGSFDRFSSQKILKNITQGSYQDKKEDVKIDVDDLNSWQPLGTWGISHYTATVGECDRNPLITTSGHLVTPGFTVAVDPHYWKFGTIFYFKDIGFGIAADTGRLVKGENRADYLTSSKTFPIPDQTEVYLVYKQK